jgi:FkbM family methyltransferase
MSALSKNPRDHTRYLPLLIDRFRRGCGYRFPPLGPFAFNLIRKSLPRKLSTMLLPGIRATLDLDDDTQLWTYWFGTRFEAPTPAILSGWAKQSTCFFDIGANYGFFSFFISAFHPGVQIFAFEPNPVIFAQLSQICAENKLISISPQPFGLSDTPGRFEFRSLTRNTGHSSFAPIEESISDQKDLHLPRLLLETERFDDFVIDAGLNYPSSPSWIAKIDVEGFEPKVLAGMSSSLRHRAFLGLCIETLDENLALLGSNTREIEIFLAEFGYTRWLEHPALMPSSKRSHHNSFFVYKPDR